MAMDDMAIISLANYDAALTAAKEKSGNPAAMTSAELAGRIRSIPEQKPEQEKTISVTDNGAAVVTPDPGKVLSKATVNVNVPKRKPEEAFTKEFTANGTYPINPTAGHVFSGGSVKVNTPVKKPEQTKAVTYTTNGSRTVSPDSGKVLTGVTVNVQVPDKPAVVQKLTVTENGTYNPPAGVDGFAPVTVDVQGGGAETATLTNDNCNIIFMWAVDDTGTARDIRLENGQSVKVLLNTMVYIKRGVVPGKFIDPGMDIVIRNLPENSTGGPGMVAMLQVVGKDAHLKWSF